MLNSNKPQNASLISAYLKEEKKKKDKLNKSQ
jgi:hypothetical protein